jgi:cytochrome c-type biogenesis protein CcmE
MRLGALFSIIIAVVGLCAMVGAFLFSASPYVTVAEAKRSKGDNLHLAGDIIPGSLVSLPRDGIVRFNVKDANGATVQVVYSGPPPANMSDATKVVAIGGMKGSDFYSNKLLLKCPSKYENGKGEKNGAASRA